jgi:exonuclease III
LQSKFLRQRDEGGWSIDYRPMSKLLRAGLVDAYTRIGARKPEARDDGGFTVPTELSHDSGHAKPMRIDYMLANSFLLSAYPRVQVRVVVNSETQAISDHFPLDILFDPT